MFWDGFQWVGRTTPLVRNFEQVTNTKKMKIANVPLELGLRADDLKRDFNRRLREKYRGDKDMIQTLTLINAQNAVGIELASKDDIGKIKETFDGLKLLGQVLRATSFEDKTMNYNVTGFGNSSASMSSLSNPLANSAQTTAQAAAIANAAIKSLQGHTVNVSLQGCSLGPRKCRHGFCLTCVASRILKVSNVVDPADIYRIGSELQDIQMDMKDEFANYGNLLDIRMIMPKQETLGGNPIPHRIAEAGSFFVEYEDIKTAELAADRVKGRKYDNKPIRVAFLNPDLYLQEFKAISQSFLTLQLDAPVTTAPQKPREDELE